ncbi:PQQ-binding-like beta-propeller repeat protein [Streptomyces sp. NPDC046203]|uniref:serine/threonine-protein kinase n=1 Tax=Streptomyces sp. NPDC046203 TaxID=3154602 RepID=UPI0033D71BDA
MLGPLREGAPRRIGPYEILARLGAGGMGEVYLGRRGGPGAADGTYVAVKTVRRDVAGEPAFRDRFRREIQVARLVRSAYAAAPVGGDADTGLPWLATAYVPGPSLSQAVRRGGPMPVATVRALGARIARALADLHAAGVLHRDLKPGNVMLAVDGPRLIDFGIARAAGATTMTATGMMVGTPAFMSPEHVAGARRVTGASDVFCLGSVLCYAATGEDPFGDGPLAAVLYRVSQAEADLERVPEELRGIVAACLALDPADRPDPERLVELLGGDDGRMPAWPEAVREHIGAYGTELAQLVAAGGPLLEVSPAAPSTVPVSDPYATPDPHAAPTMGPTGAPAVPAAGRPPRRRRRALLAAAVALAVVGGGLGAYLLWPRPVPELKPLKAAPGPRVPGVDDRGLMDASGVVPQYAAQRPAGWKPWRAKLSAPAFGCSANEKALVCRTTDGRYEALDPANGKPLWQADLVEDDRDNRSFISPTGGIFIAGATARPVVHDGLVVLASGGRVQVRDARGGAVRWEKPGWSRMLEPSRPIVTDDTVFVVTPAPGTRKVSRTGLTAYALADGRKLWERQLTNDDLSRAQYKGFEPVAYAAGTVYALSDGGLIAYDAKTGAVRGQVDADARTCETIKVLGTRAYCAEISHTLDAPEKAHLLDASSLATQASLPAPVAKLRPAVLTERTAAGFDDGKGTLKVFDARDGKELGSYAATTAGTAAGTAAQGGLAQVFSQPLLAGDQVVYADYSSLYTVRLGKDGKPTGLRTVPVPGAPGARAGGPSTLDYAEMLRGPEVLPVGGIGYLAYDQGVVTSMELPR